MFLHKQYQFIREESDTERTTSYKKHDNHLDFIIKNVDSKEEINVDYNDERLIMNIDNLSHTFVSHKKTLSVITEESIKKESKETKDKNEQSSFYSSFHQSQQSITLDHPLDLEKATVIYNTKKRTAILSIPYKEIKKITVKITEE